MNNFTESKVVTTEWMDHLVNVGPEGFQTKSEYFGGLTKHLMNNGFGEESIRLNARLAARFAIACLPVAERRPFTSLAL